MNQQKIYADAQLAKCQVFDKGAELQQLSYWGIDCNVEDIKKDIDELSRAIWLAQLDCIEYNDLCKVGKRLNAKRLSKVVCDPEDEDICTGTFDCSQITVEFIEPEDCSIPITAIQ